MDNTLITNAANALVAINTLINESYGGLVSNEEWNNPEIPIYTIYKDRRCRNFYVGKTCVHSAIAFHTKEDAKSFLSDSEHVDLIKNYYMI